jgi:hypothetical protein
VMREQSHKDEMASLLKADFDRLRARGVATTLAPQPPVVTVEPEIPAPDPEPDATVENVLDIAEPADRAVEVASGSGWLRRLLGQS